MLVSMSSVEPHGLNKTLTFAESQQLNEYLSRRRSELEEDRRRQFEELEAYEEYFRHAMDTLDTNTPEGQAQMQRIYQLWTRYRNSTDAFFRSGNMNGRSNTSEPVSPSPPAANTNASNAPRYAPGLTPAESPSYVPLSPLFDADPFAAPSPPRPDTHEFSYFESAFPSDNHLSVEIDALLRSPDSYAVYQHVAFYTHQNHQAPALILTDGYKNSLYSEPVSDHILQDAFAHLLVEQTVRLIVEPGHYRAGQGGADESLWGKAAVSIAELARAGRQIPSSAPWGRMGMDHINFFAPVRQPPPRPISHINRVQNPYQLSLDFLPRNIESLHGTAHRLISRMRIPITSVVAAIWFLQGLPFHDGDGQSGHEFRQFIRKLARQDTQRMVKLIITLGLLLAGKWLDDNAYHNRTWSDIGHIPLREIDRLEHLALGHYCYSLNLPGNAWFKHVNAQADLLECRCHDEHNWILITQMRQMCDAAEESEARLADQIHWSHALAHERRHVFGGRSGSSSPRSQYHTERDETQACGVCSAGLDAEDDSGAEEVDLELGCCHERYVSALVDEDDADVATDDDDAMSEFVDYDGAEPFITREHMRRSVSVSSSMMDAEIPSMARSGTDEDTDRLCSIPVTLPSQIHPLPLTYPPMWFRSDAVQIQAYECYKQAYPFEKAAYQPGVVLPTSSAWDSSEPRSSVAGSTKGQMTYVGA